MKSTLKNPREKRNLITTIDKSPRNHTNELLFVAYVFTFPLSGLLIPFLKQYSTHLLAVPTLIILLISFWINAKQKRLNPEKFYVVVIFLVALLLLVDMATRHNIYSYTYTYQFIIFGIIPMYLLSKVRDLGQVLKYLAFFAIPVILLYSPDPFFEYFMTGDYLKFGYFAMLPAYLAVYVGRKYLGYRWLLPLEIMAMLQLIFFSNRGSLVTALVFVVLSKIFVDKGSFRKFLFILVMAIATITFTFYLKPVLKTSIEYLQENNLESYSLRSIYQSIDQGDDVYSGRQIIWKNAETMFVKSPIIGNGTGYFISQYGIYTHNIFLEILTSWGIIGVSVIILFCVAYLYTIAHATGISRIFMLYMAVLGIVPLLFSLAIFSWMYFWLFVYSIKLSRLNA